MISKLFFSDIGFTLKENQTYLARLYKMFCSLAINITKC